VDHATARKREQLRLEDMAVCDHHTDVGREPAEALDEVGIAGPGGLEHRDVLGFGRRLHRRRDRGRAGASLRLVWLRDYRDDVEPFADRKSTRLNSSHVSISYAVFCLKKKKKNKQKQEELLLLIISTF